MNKPYPSSNATSDADSSISSSSSSSIKQTRFDAAKEALLGLVTDLMLESKTNLCGVIVLHTLESSHHLLPSEQDTTVGPKDENDCDGEEEDEMKKKKEEGKYRHITELSPVERPTVDLLRQIDQLSCFRDSMCDDECDTVATGKSVGSVHVPPRQGGFCDGIIVAASAMYRRTLGKKFSRKIILLTDAEREVDIHWDELDDVVAGLRQIECSLTVIGLDFNKSAEFEEAAVIDDNKQDDAGAKENYGDDICCDNIDAGHSMEMVPDETHRLLEDPMASKDEDLSVRVKDENEKFLISLTKYTGGQVYSTCTIQQMLKQASGRRIPKSTLSKIDFQIAPGVTVDARVSLYTSQQSFPTLKREAISFDSNGQIERNDLGEVMCVPVTNVTSHWDADEPDVEVDLEHRAQGYPYGSDLIPVGAMELEGLKMRSNPRITILGYASMECIPMSVWMGPMRIVSGEKDSRRACLAISAIAQALLKLNQVAICTFVKQKDSDPDMGILLPLVEDEKIQPMHLLYVRIPYADDIQNLTMNPLCDAVDEEAASVCDELIDAFMLPQHALNPASIPNPAIRSFRKMMIRRALHPDEIELEEMNSNRVADVEDQVATSVSMSEKKKNALIQFRATFPLEVVPTVTNGNKQKKRYFLSDSQD
jgi:ATP-dependent DNA helicase 2 subunit 2